MNEAQNSLFLNSTYLIAWFSEENILPGDKKMLIWWCSWNKSKIIILVQKESAIQGKFASYNFLENLIFKIKSHTMNEEIKIKDFSIPSLFKFLTWKYFISVSLDNFIQLKWNILSYFFLTEFENCALFQTGNAFWN